MMGGQNGGGGGQLIFLLLIFVVFYFFMIRPQQQKSKREKQFHAELKKGDRVVTGSGIHGKIAEVQETTFIIETEGGGKLKVEKAAVSHDMSKAAQQQNK